MTQMTGNAGGASARRSHRVRMPAQVLAVAGVIGLGLFPGIDGLSTVSLAQRERPAGWDDATHHERVAPDYDRLFTLDRVHELHITIAPDDFRAMQDDLRAIGPNIPGMGGRGGRGGVVQPLAGAMEAATAACTEKPAETPCSANGSEGRCTALFGGPLMCVPAAIATVQPGGVQQGAFPPGGFGRGGFAPGVAPDLIGRDPIWVPVTVRHDGRVWTHAGMRYKGNSSLLTASVSGNGKVPFRLQSDRFEDDAPATRNQRFYGFQRLTFSSGFTDDSQLHEVMAAEVLRDRGVPAARAAFYRVTVDVGTGPEYWGLYTMVEDPADGAMLDAQFGSRTGNLYKPEGVAANWTRFDIDSFENRTGGNPEDATDVQAAIAALHAPRDDPRAWREALEATIDVDGFLRWLAVNAVIENWDAYGMMAHNYYLYGDPAANGRLAWIPWDHNMAFGTGPGGMMGRFGGGAFGAGRGAPGGGGRGGPPQAGGPMPPPGGGFAMALPFGPGNTDVLHARTGEQWPLIRRLLDDEVYAARYREMLTHALGGLAAPDAFAARARALHALITPAIVGEQGERPTHTTISSPEAFLGALDGPDGLLERVARRREVIRAALEAR